MSKKNNYAGNKQNDRSSSSWIPTSILDSNDLHSSSMTQSKLDEIKSLFSFKVNVVMPAPNHTVDWFLHGWVCFYSYPFDMGMRFPFSDLTTSRAVHEQSCLGLVSLIRLPQIRVSLVEPISNLTLETLFPLSQVLPRSKLSLKLSHIDNLPKTSSHLEYVPLRSPTGHYLRNTFVTLLCEPATIVIYLYLRVLCCHKRVMDTKIKHLTKSLLILLVIPSMSFKLLHWLKNSIEKELDNFITVQGEHNDCQEKIAMVEDQSFLHLKRARDIQKEFEEFVEKVGHKEQIPLSRYVVAVPYEFTLFLDFHLLDDDENDIVEGFVEFLAKPGSDLKQHFKGAKGEIVATVTWMGAA
ncbi:hypothetical protein POM88_000047 [Heracleum sosnowskyi]|uniref:Uncharacterized protein n=1 Tax=Heracleum sosnowskyi TaxID=360622 RepID=A0AAD8N8Z3_9APIA|nr:hypothetical protein POM88_000047 [Heracleum sosnowskyi]